VRTVDVVDVIADVAAAHLPAIAAAWQIAVVIVDLGVNGAVQAIRVAAKAHPATLYKDNSRHTKL